MAVEERSGIRFATAAYRRLLAIYPKKFRAEYGEAMTQVFRDQCRHEYQHGGGMALAIHGLRVLAESIWTSIGEHIQERKETMNPIPTLPVRSRSRTFLKISTTTFVLLAVGVVAVSLLLPKVFSSSARLDIGGSGPGSASYDPYLIQTEFERIKSRKVLEPVVTELGLVEWFSTRAGTKVRIEEALVMLRDMIEIRQSRNTSLFQIRVSTQDDNGVTAAAIANKIAEVYGQTASGLGRKVSLVDAASPELRPIRPNLPLNITLGLILSGVFALCGGLVVALWPHRPRSV